MTAERIHGGDQIAIRIVLQNVSSGACSQNFLDQEFRIVHGQYEDLSARGKFAYLAGRFDSVEQWHPDVEHCHIRFELAGFLYRFPAIGGLCANLPSRMGLDQSTESRSHDVMVISYQNPDWH